GGNSSLPVAHTPWTDGPTSVRGCAGSTHRGLTKRSTRSGTASAMYCCLSNIDDELSITNSRSTLSIAALAASASTTCVVEGSLDVTGRVRQLANDPNDARTTTRLERMPYRWPRVAPSVTRSCSADDEPQAFARNAELRADPPPEDEPIVFHAV